MLLRSRRTFRSRLRVAAVVVSCAVVFGAVAVSARYPASAASGASLEAWGYDNGSGPVHGAAQIPSPPLPAGVTVKQIAVSVATYYVVTTGGSLYAWGGNNCGQVGDGTYTDRPSPWLVPFPAGVRITQVSAADGGVMALSSTGVPYLWGCNGPGGVLLGNPGAPSTQPNPTPLAVMPNGVQFIQIAMGSSAAMALGSDAQVYAWGQNGAGQLGQGAADGPNVHLTTTTPQRVQFPAGVNIVDVATNGSTGVAASDTGTLYTWGYNGHGELGRGPNAGVGPDVVMFPAPVQIVQGTVGNDYVIVRDASGGAWGFGSDQYGELGNDSTQWSSDVPVAVQFPSGVTATTVASGDGSGHTLAVASNGDIYAWGSNFGGELGVTGPNGVVPARVPLAPGLTGSLVAAGGGLSFALVQPAGPGPLDHLALTPSTVSIPAGASQTYTAEGFDASNTDVGDVTASTSFSITPDGICTGATCTPALPGPHTVTGTDHGQTGTASLTATDATPPTTAIGIAPATPSGLNGWYTGPVAVSVNATDPDNAASTLTTRCVLDPASAPANFGALPATPCSLTGAGQSVSTNGAHVVYTASQDPAGNTETVQSAAFKIDTVAPSTTAKSTPGALPPNVGLITLTGTATIKNTAGTVVGTIGPGTCYNTAGQVIGVSAADNPGGSGVASITYSATGAQPFMVTTVNGASTSVPITTTGSTTLTYAATDAAGNRETSKSVTVLAGNGGLGVGFACSAPTPTFTPPTHGTAVLSGTALIGTATIPFTISIRF